MSAANGIVVSPWATRNTAAVDPPSMRRSSRVKKSLSRGRALLNVFVSPLMPGPYS